MSHPIEAPTWLEKVVLKCHFKANLTPEQYCCQALAAWYGYYYDQWEYQDTRVHKWVHQVGLILSSSELLSAAERQNLTIEQQHEWLQWKCQMANPRLATEQEEDSTFENYGNTGMTADEYGAKRGHLFGCFALDQRRYRNAALDSWIRRLGKVLHAPGLAWVLRFQLLGETGARHIAMEIEAEETAWISALADDPQQSERR